MCSYAVWSSFLRKKMCEWYVRQIRIATTLQYFLSILFDVTRYRIETCVNFDVATVAGAVLRWGQGALAPRDSPVAPRFKT